MFSGPDAVQAWCFPEAARRWCSMFDASIHSRTVDQVMRVPGVVTGVFAPSSSAKLSCSAPWDLDLWLGIAELGGE